MGILMLLLVLKVSLMMETYMDPEGELAGEMEMDIIILLPTEVLMLVKVLLQEEAITLTILSLSLLMDLEVAEVRSMVELNSGTEDVDA